MIIIKNEINFKDENNKIIPEVKIEDSSHSAPAVIERFKGISENKDSNKEKTQLEKIISLGKISNEKTE